MDGEKKAIAMSFNSIIKLVDSIEGDRNTKMNKAVEEILSFLNQSNAGNGATVHTKTNDMYVLRSCIEMYLFYGPKHEKIDFIKSEYNKKVLQIFKRNQNMGR